MPPTDMGHRLRGGAVFAAWAATLAALIWSGKLHLFVRPEFAWLVGMGACIATAFLIAVIRQPIPMPLSRTLVLLLTLLHVAASDPATIGKDLIRNRLVNPRNQDAAPATRFNVAPETQFRANGTVDNAVIDQGFARFGDEQTNPDQTAMHREPELTLLQLLRAPERYHNSTVRVLGLIHRDATLAEYFGSGRDVVVYRFVITCCAADALPVSIALEGNIPPLPADQWVEVDGLFAILPHANHTVPVLHVEQITPIAPPAAPFLY